MKRCVEASDVAHERAQREGRSGQGRVKQAVGTLTGNDALKAEGQVDETVGEVEAAVGRVSRNTDEAITRVGKAVKR
jgi:uncharacterized protein YjbJ (UPF0337 family)